MFLNRTFLFCPGAELKMIKKAIATEADVIIIDLEDSIAMDAKEEARGNVVKVLQAESQAKQRLFVRINSWDSSWGRKDLLEILKGNPGGIMLPKAQYLAEVKQVLDLIPPQVELIPLIETALGIINAYQIAQLPGVRRLAFGAIDFTLEIGTSHSKQGSEVFYARSHLVVASRAAGKEPPIDTVFPDLQDMAGFQEELNLSKQLGMFGKLLIHPNQIALANNTFTPSPGEVTYAQKVIAAFNLAVERGIAAIQVDNKLVDYAVVKKAEKILELAQRIRVSKREA